MSTLNARQTQRCKLTKTQHLDRTAANAVRVIGQSLGMILLGVALTLTGCGRKPAAVQGVEAVDVLAGNGKCGEAGETSGRGTTKAMLTTKLPPGSSGDLSLKEPGSLYYWDGTRFFAICCEHIELALPREKNRQEGGTGDLVSSGMSTDDSTKVFAVCFVHGDVYMTDGSVSKGVLLKEGKCRCCGRWTSTALGSKPAP